MPQRRRAQVSWVAFQIPAAPGGLTAFVLSATKGNYVATGTSTSALCDRLVNATAGSVTVTGTSATVLHDRLLSATAGVYTRTGFSTSLVVSLGRRAQVSWVEFEVPAAGDLSVFEPGVFAPGVFSLQGQ